MRIVPDSRSECPPTSSLAARAWLSIAWAWASEPAPGLGQRVALRRAVDELGAERLLEGGDPPPHRRRVEPERAAGRLEASVPGDGEKDPEVVPFHGAFLHGGTHHSIAPLHFCNTALNVFVLARLVAAAMVPRNRDSRRSGAMQDLGHFIDGKRVAGRSGPLRRRLQSRDRRGPGPRRPRLEGRARRRRRERRAPPRSNGAPPTRSAARG